VSFVPPKIETRTRLAGTNNPMAWGRFGASEDHDDQLEGLHYQLRLFFSKVVNFSLMLSKVDKWGAPGRIAGGV
jgi:hypothetical protein